jgi:hypothetical protein
MCYYCESRNLRKLKSVKLRNKFCYFYNLCSLGTLKPGTDRPVKFVGELTKSYLGTTMTVCFQCVGGLLGPVLSVTGLKSRGIFMSSRGKYTLATMKKSKLLTDVIYRDFTSSPMK